MMRVSLVIPYLWCFHGFQQWLLRHKESCYIVGVSLAARDKWCWILCYSHGFTLGLPRQKAGFRILYVSPSVLRVSLETSDIIMNLSPLFVSCYCGKPYSLKSFRYVIRVLHELDLLLYISTLCLAKPCK
jgi:hypothetical protein